MTYIQEQRKKAPHAKAQRRKERQERTSSWQRRNGRALRLFGFARPRRCLKRRLTQRRKDAKKGKNGFLLGTEETAVLCAFAALRDPAVAYTIDSVKRRLTQRRKDAKKDKKGYSRLAAASQTVEWSGLAVAAEREGRQRGRVALRAGRRRKGATPEGLGNGALQPLLKRRHNRADAKE